MTIRVTAKGLVPMGWGACKDLARSAWTRVRTLSHGSIADAAQVAGVDRSHASRWESEKTDHPVPLAVLWNRDLVPDDEFDALVEQARRDRAGQAARVKLATPEGALDRVCLHVLDMLKVSIRALADRHLSPDEVAELRPQVRELMKLGRELLDVWDHAERAQASASRGAA